MDSGSEGLKEESKSLTSILNLLKEPRPNMKPVWLLVHSPVTPTVHRPMILLQPLAASMPQGVGVDIVGRLFSAEQSDI